MTLLVIDNFDSFTYNLVQLLGQIYQDEIIIYRNNQLTLEQVKSINPEYIVLSPGPGNPSNSVDFGICHDVLTKISLSVPTLGVCLGHQGIGYAFGGKINGASMIKHGKTSEISHNDTSLFKNIPNPIVGARYHSLVIDPNQFPKELEILATSEDNEIMAIRHKKFPIYGLQFHPESILTEHGFEILENFIYGAN